MIVTLEASKSSPVNDIITATRTCYQSFEKQNEASDSKLLAHLLKNNESPLEFAQFTFRLQDISRACSHQLVRHRIGSFAQKSQRYCKEEEFQYEIPPGVATNTREIAAPWGMASPIQLYKITMFSIQSAYNTLIKAGIKAEDARYLLPNACHTELIWSLNLRSLRNFWGLRLAPKAQWEIRDVAKETLKLVKSVDERLIEGFEIED